MLFKYHHEQKKIERFQEYLQRLLRRYREVGDVFKACEALYGTRWNPSVQDILDIVYELRQLAEETEQLMRDIRVLDAEIDKAPCGEAEKG